MNAAVPYAVWAIIAIICLGVACIAIFGLRGLAQGKASPLTIALMAVPVVLLVGLGLIMSSWAMAAMWTTIIMFALGLLALFSSGLWGLFT